MKTVAILGTGDVGQALAGGFVKKGYSVVFGTRSPGKKIAWKDDSTSSIRVLDYASALKGADAVILAVKGTAAEGVVKSIAGDLAGKLVIDTTNPIAEAPPKDGVLSFFTGLDESLMERLQKISPKARFVKAFNSIGSSLMVDSAFGAEKPAMFYCGNDGMAKNEAKEIISLFGFEPEDMGMAAAARAIEPLCMLWCIPGLLRNEWSHAFRLLKK